MDHVSEGHLHELQLEAEGSGPDATVVSSSVAIACLAFGWSIFSPQLFPEEPLRSALAAAAGVGAAACAGLAALGFRALGAWGLVAIVWGTVTASLMARQTLADPPTSALLVVLVLAVVLHRGAGLLAALGLLGLTVVLVEAPIQLPGPLFVGADSEGSALAVHAMATVALGSVSAVAIRGFRRRESLSRRRARLLAEYAGELSLRPDPSLPLPDQLAELRRRLSEKNRFALIGRMTAGITHDFRNLLMGVTGELELASASGPGNESLSHAIDASRRAAEIAEQILGLLRDDSPRHAPLDLASLVSELLPIVRAALPRTVQVEAQVDPAWVEGSETQLHQVLLNLCLNGAAAMPEGGVLRIRVATSDTGPHTAVIEVEDEGVGMSAETVSRIFDPLYSTKRPEEGSGLGMSIVKRIVEAHAGTVRIHSVPGEGTTIAVALPLLDEAVPAPGTSVVRDPETGCIVVRAEGMLSERQVERILDELEALDPSGSSDALYDYSAVAGVQDISAQSIRDLAATLACAPERLATKRVAIVASDHTLHSMGSALPNTTGTELPGLRVFHEVSDARRYLGLERGAAAD